MRKLDKISDEEVDCVRNYDPKKCDAKKLELYEYLYRGIMQYFQLLTSSDNKLKDRQFLP